MILLPPLVTRVVIAPLLQQSQRHDLDRRQDQKDRKRSEIGAEMGNLTVSQVAERLGVAVATVYTLCSRRKLAHVRIGVGRGAIRIPEQAVEEYVKRATVQPEEQAASLPRSVTSKGSSGFSNLDGARLLAAWRQQGVVADPPGARSARSSASSCVPSAPPES